ncbi:uncharacterized protein [Antedon mediterranea]|uniref:uncharacterized protein n=1 Tax=Antedon mediterranea TaxID=105859 RepID=UPI003AF7B85C
MSTFNNKGEKSSGFVLSNKLVNETNALLQEENRSLKSQLELLKENSDLKSATLISVLASWMSGKRLNISRENNGETCCSIPQKELSTIVYENKSKQCAHAVEGITCDCSIPIFKNTQPIRETNHKSRDQTDRSYTETFQPKIHSTPKKNIMNETSSRSRLSDASALTEMEYIDKRPLTRTDFSLGASAASLSQGTQEERELKLRIIGEIAFQLDRRIVSYIFRMTDQKNSKRRFYGYTLLTMTTMIDVESAGDLSMRQHFIDKLRKVVTFLSPLGFDIEYHPSRLVAIVNKFGRLNIMNRTAETTEPYLEEACFNALLDDLQLEQTERFDMLILLTSLKAMSRIDGFQLFLF